MSKPFIERILDAHNIEHRDDDGRIIAVEVYTVNGVPGEDPIDVTDWSFDRLYSWLGYSAPGIW